MLMKYVNKSKDGMFRRFQPRKVTNYLGSGIYTLFPVIIKCKGSIQDTLITLPFIRLHTSTPTHTHAPWSPPPPRHAAPFTCKRTVTTQPLFNTKAKQKEKFETNGHFVFATLNITFFVPRLRRFPEASRIKV